MIRRFLAGSASQLRARTGWESESVLEAVTQNGLA